MPAKSASATKAAKPVWINPVGGMGDMLYTAGVLKAVHEQFPQRRYHMIRRTGYLSLFRDHPIIAGIGSPSPGAEVIGTDYWSEESAEQRPFRVLAERFGLSPSVPERLDFPDERPGGSLIERYIPWGRQKVAIISVGADSPRKMIPPIHWHYLVDKLLARGLFVIQVGFPVDIHIKGAFSLLGLTRPNQLVQLVKKADLVITGDNDLVPIASMTGTPAICLWGPTDPNTRGFPHQVNLSAPLDFCSCAGECRRLSLRRQAVTPCPEKEGPCTNKIPLDFVIFSAHNLTSEEVGRHGDS